MNIRLRYRTYSGVVALSVLCLIFLPAKAMALRPSSTSRTQATLEALEKSSSPGREAQIKNYLPWIIEKPKRVLFASPPYPFKSWERIISQIQERSIYWHWLNEKHMYEELELFRRNIYFITNKIIQPLAGVIEAAVLSEIDFQDYTLKGRKFPVQSIYIWNGTIIEHLGDKDDAGESRDIDILVVVKGNVRPGEVRIEESEKLELPQQLHITYIGEDRFCEGQNQRERFIKMGAFFRAVHVYGIDYLSGKKLPKENVLVDTHRLLELVFDGVSEQDTSRLHRNRDKIIHAALELLVLCPELGLDFFNGHIGHLMHEGPEKLHEVAQAAQRAIDTARSRVQEILDQNGRDTFLPEVDIPNARPAIAAFVISYEDVDTSA
jgi:hypothetical protein